MKVVVQMLEQDIQYGTDAMQKLDLYTPASSNGRSLVLIHGGGWWQGDKHKEMSTAARFVDMGYTVAAINYRLALAATNLFPTQNRDVLAAYQWLIAHEPSFTAQNIAFIGGSTGGHLAAYLGLTLGRPFVSLSGLFDLAGFYAAHPDVTPVQRIFSKHTASSAIDQDGSDDGYYKWIIENLLPEITPAQLDAASIWRWVRATSGPGLLINSLHELVPASEPLQLAGLLQAKSVPVETILLPGTRHGEAYLPDVIGSVQQFLDRYF
ncbi:alpha/beta hydrolase [Lacticaseibacillus sharpeae]|uniref:Esterase lipase n=1 Tax=Lacticaseibacillus sharpeae JCM 1186 = DSM 20505 TaxID=1291052 RepID=A0A0R1ZK41_9LACO|nr:alpha/beta hydrolase [Lacticaseibacillus sharpeae]KRM54730.1 esterase lipase [Lacticaseibacillus sharpeae JCM 1186 = DSM 20505]